MRKFFSALVCAFMMLFALSGCGGEETKTVVLEATKAGITMTVELQAKGDKIEKIIQTSTIDKKEASESILTQVSKASKLAAEKYKPISGADYSYEDGADAFKEVITLNVGDKDTLKELIKEKLLPVSDDKINTLSLKQSVENYEKLGLKQK